MEIGNIAQWLSLGLAFVSYMLESIYLFSSNELSRSFGRLAGGVWRLALCLYVSLFAYGIHSLPLVYEFPDREIYLIAFVLQSTLFVTGLITLGSGVHKLRNYLREASK